MKTGYVAAFCAEWTQMLWQAMHKTQRGVRLNKMGHSGRGKDRRADKLTDETGKPPQPAILRSYKARYRTIGG